MGIGRNIRLQSSGTGDFCVEFPLSNAFWSTFPESHLLAHVEPFKMLSTLKFMATLLLLLSTGLSHECESFECVSLEFFSMLFSLFWCLSRNSSICFHCAVVLSFTVCCFSVIWSFFILLFLSSVTSCSSAFEHSANFLACTFISVSYVDVERNLVFFFYLYQFNPLESFIINRLDAKCINI